MTRKVFIYNLEFYCEVCAGNRIYILNHFLKTVPEDVLIKCPVCKEVFVIKKFKILKGDQDGEK